MADTHIEVDETFYHARKLMDPVRELTTRLGALDDLFAAMGHMKDGDGSQDAHFQKVVDLFGVKGADSAAKLANAHTLYNEMNSAQGNSTALRQLLAILG